MKKTLLACTVLTLATLAGCSSKPDHLLLDPIITAGVALPPTFVTVNVEDQRIANYIVKINENDDRHRLIAPAEKLTKTLERSLQQALTQQGAQLSEQGNFQFTLTVQEFVTSIEQNTLNFESSSQATVTAIIKHDDTVFRKKFSASRSRSEPLKPSMASMESDLNQLIERLISNVVTDAELQQFIIQKGS